ncbi:MAG: DUF4296 domain-containing protein [Mucilaginibacter sp.]
MRKYISLFFSAIIVLCACNDNTPDGVIEKEEMIDLLVDVHTIDGTLFNISSTPDSAYKYGTGRYINVFKTHSTDSAQFNRSLKYYATQPDLLKAMYDTIGNRIQVKVDSTSKLLQREQAKKAKQNPGAMLRGKGMLPGTMKLPTKDSLETNIKAKMDSARYKKRMQLMIAKAKFKADSAMRAKKMDSVKVRKVKVKFQPKKA